jgi:hypothetical protein
LLVRIPEKVPVPLVKTLVDNAEGKDPELAVYVPIVVMEPFTYKDFVIYAPPAV